MHPDPRLVVLQFNEAINRQDLVRLIAWMTEDHLFVDSAGSSIRDRAKVRAAWSRFFAAFPDYVNVVDLIEERADGLLMSGSSVCSEPALQGPATWTAVVRDGLVAEWWIEARDLGPKQRSIRIREERPDDVPGIRHLCQAAFEGPFEASIVDALRSAGAVTASMVAVDGDEIIGHVLFSPISIVGSREDRRILGLAPMAVLPRLHRSGVGSTLLRRALDHLRHAGYGAVVLVGHPDYYPRFGFVPAGRFGLRCEIDCPDEAFMALELQPDSLSGLEGGLVRYRPELTATSA